MYNTPTVNRETNYKIYMLTISSWEICLSMRQISLRERVEIAWFTRDI